MTTEVVAEQEEIEGLGDVDSSWPDYPIDTLLIRNETRTVHDVLRRIDKDQYVMDPDFQRDFIWDSSKQSRLIESVLMRIPLPVFYLAEDEQGRMVVVDGLQRLTTFQRFANNELRLRLPKQKELDGKRFKDLPPKLQNRVEDCNLTMYVIDAKAPDQTRLDIFERVNGGVPLTRQQMRNSLYMGEATAFLKEQAHSALFLEATGKSLRTATMRDREFVNRFCAFQLLDVADYSDMDDFLAAGLNTMNESPGLLGALSAQLHTTLRNNLTLFGRHAFRKHRPEQDNRSVINASLWDVMSTGLSRYPKELVEEYSIELKNDFYKLMEKTKFVEAITYGTNDALRVQDRFGMTRKMFVDVLGAY